MNRFLVPLMILLAASSLISPTSTAMGDDSILSKQAELQRLRKEIENYELKIRESEKREQTTLELLDTYDRQASLVRTLVNRLRKDESQLQTDIEETKRAMQQLSGQISHLKQQYARYVSTLYKKGRTYDFELLFTSTSVNQMLVRSEYLKRFSVQRQKDVATILEKKDDAEEHALLLKKQLREQQEIIIEKRKEESNIASMAEKRKKLLSGIRRDKTLLRQEVNRAQNAAKGLEMLISQLIEEEQKRKEREAALPKGTLPNIEPDPYLKGLSFEQKRGKVRWPVPHGQIIARFGNQQHPILKTITQNTGIDIGVPVGTEVGAVSNGEVSKISWLPSFGNLVIVDHSRGYRTVYAHLSEVTVSEGDKVEEGMKIGKSGESLSGQILHFEIWKDRQKQNPEDWLSPRGLTRR